MAQLRLPSQTISRVEIGFVLLTFFTLIATVATHAQTGAATTRALELQPLASQVRRVVQAMDYLGEPLTANEKAALEGAITKSDGSAIEQIQSILDAHVLAVVTINPEMRVSVTQGAARPELVEQGWRQFLVKVKNQSGTTARLVAVSSNAQSVYGPGQHQSDSDRHFHHGERGSAVPPIGDLWLDLQSFVTQPLQPTLSGLALEYRIVQLYSRDAGQREAKISFNVGQGTQDLGFRNEIDLLFTCRPAQPILLHVRDEHGSPTTASFTIRDTAGRVYPSQAKRLAPDFGFHPQVYRTDGETLRLPEGDYAIRTERGPESVPQLQPVHVGSTTSELSFQIVRLRAAD